MDDAVATYGDQPMKFQSATSAPDRPATAFWIAVAGNVVLAGEAARLATWPWLAAATVLSAVVAWYAWYRVAGARGTAVGLVLLLLGLGVATVRLAHVVVHARILVAEAVRDATAARDRDLATAVDGAIHVARTALQRAGKSPPEEVPPLADLVRGAPLEEALAVLGGDTVIAVAGPQRTPPRPGGAPARLVITPFSHALALREQLGNRIAEVTLLLDALPSLPSAGPSLAGRAGKWQGVRWRWDAPGDSEVAFASVPAAIAGVERAMVPIAPDSAAYVAREAATARWVVAAGLIALALLVLLSASQVGPRAGALLVPLWAVLRSGVATGITDARLIEALLVTVAVAELAIIAWRRGPRRRIAGGVVAAILIAGAPALIVFGARAVIPVGELQASRSWFLWEAVVAVAAAGYLALANVPLRSADDDAAPRWAGWLAAVAALVIGAIGVEGWTPAGWSAWYVALWVVPLGLLLPRMPARLRLGALACCAVVLAALATWGTSLDRTMSLASADLARLDAGSDPLAVGALDAFADSARAVHATRLDRLYAAWRNSPLWRDGFPSYLSLWDSTGHQFDEVPLDSLSVSWFDLAPLVRGVDSEPEIVPLARGAGHHDVLVLPLTPDTIATVMVGPRSRLLVPTVFGQLTGWRSTTTPSYRVDVIPAAAASSDTAFYRTHRFIRTDRVVTRGDYPRTVRAEIEIDKPAQYIVRALLVTILDLLLVGAVWFGLQWIFGQWRPPGSRVFRRSYRRMIATALMAFFIVPAALFTLWSVYRLRLSAADQRADELEATLRDVTVRGGLSIADARQPSHDSLALVADDASAELGVYRDSRLIAASNPILEQLGLLPAVINPPSRGPAVLGPVNLSNALPGGRARVGVQATARPATLIAAVLPGGETDFERGQVDLAMLLVLTTLAGAGAAIFVAGRVADGLGQPIDMLRRTALAIGRRETAPLAERIPAEFVPVFGAISQMEHDLRDSEAELRAGRARTAAILATVATGVIGVDGSGTVTHANPRAGELLGNAIAVGAPIGGQLPEAWAPVSHGVTRLLGRHTRTPESFELPVEQRRYEVTLAPLADGGLVLAITDITEAARAARVLAWGEMARQVAHEIKNPLTPMRLGLQHLRRVTEGAGDDVDPGVRRLVDETVARLLAEIERLDRIARSFARYGAPPDQSAAPLEAIDLRMVSDEIAGLYGLASEGLQIEVTGTGTHPVRARREELVQVLLNLLDNARQAGADRIRLAVDGGTLHIEDNGPGIPPDQLGRIFEPSFSTRTSGTGLGLAIVRRLVEGWGATIGARSAPGRGAAFVIRFVADGDEPGATGA